MGLLMLWKPETSRIFRPWLLCSRIGGGYYQASASRSARISRAPTLVLASMSILRLLDLSFAPSLKVFNGCLNLLHKDLLPHNDRWFCTPTLFRLQTLGIRVLKGPWLTIPQPRTHCKRNATIVDRRVISPIHAQPTFTSSSNTGSYFSTTTNS
jgi:hypothetical protein